MKVLLDTHTLLWSQDGSENLGAAARTIIEDSANELWVGAGSLWELAIKVTSGKLRLGLPIRDWIDTAKKRIVFEVLGIEVQHICHFQHVVVPHKDPFDRILCAQALVENMAVLSCDRLLDSSGIRRIWDR